MQKATEEIILSSRESSFLIRKFDRRGFLAPFHFHPEFELTYILEGRGKRFVGNNMSSFRENDLVLIGSNLPHCWKLAATEKIKAGSVVIQFTPEQFAPFMNNQIPEFNSISNLLRRSNNGIQFSEKIAGAMKKDIQSIFIEKDKFKRLLILLRILKSLSNTRQFTLLNRNDFVHSQSAHNRERLNKVNAYIIENFQENISLKKAAQIIGMTPNAFCKYYKNITRETLMETVINLRIDYAIQQLIETDKSITDICFESGFGDVSHFYKIFSSRMKMSPLRYRNKYQLEIG